MGFFFQFIIRQELIFDAPLSGKEFGDVVSDGVTEDTDYSFGFVVLPSFLFNELKRCLHNRSWWSANQQPFFLNEISCISERWQIIGLHPVINVSPFASFWHEVISNSLHFIDWVASFIEFLGHSQNTAEWISANQKSSWALFFDFPGDSCHLSSCSDSDDDCIDLAVALVDDFLGQLVVVC